MMGLEAWLSQFTEGSEALLMLGATALLVLFSFIADMAVEIKNRDLKLNDFGRFTKAILLNALFLLGLELLMIPALRIPLAYDIFMSIQMGGWVGVMVYYFFGFYKNLKKLGLQTNQAIEERIQNLVNEEQNEGGHNL